MVQRSLVYPLPSFNLGKWPTKQSQTLFWFYKYYFTIYAHCMCVCMSIYSSIQFYHGLTCVTSATIKIHNCTPKIYFVLTHSQHSPSCPVLKTWLILISINLSFWECYINRIFFLLVFLRLFHMKTLKLPFFPLSIMSMRFI